MGKTLDRRGFLKLGAASAGAAIGRRSCSGDCDGACPFGRQVRAGLLEAHESLSWDGPSA